MVWNAQQAKINKLAEYIETYDADSVDEKIKGLELDISLAKIEVEHGSRLLENCEAALVSRDKEIDLLRNHCIEWRDRVNSML